jgi:hypothetical protein
MGHLIMDHGVSWCFGTILAPIALTCSLRSSASPTSDHLTPQEITNQDAPEMGSLHGGLLKSLMTWVIPFVCTVLGLLSPCASLSLSASNQPVLCTPLTLY